MTTPPPPVLLPPPQHTERTPARLATLGGWFLAVNTLIVLATFASGLGESASRGARTFIAWCGIG